MHNMYFTNSKAIKCIKKLYENPKLMTLFRYQKQARIYLDEYPKQKELRKEYFKPEANFFSRWLIRK